MLSKQVPDGSFPEPGRVIHKDMKVSVVRVRKETDYISLKTTNGWSEAVNPRLTDKQWSTKHHT